MAPGSQAPLEDRTAPVATRNPNALEAFWIQSPFASYAHALRFGIMSIPYNPEQDLSDAAASVRRGEFHTLSSKMFDTYLTDIEQLLHHQIWNAALTDALALPHIAVALSDARRRSSAERYQAWCATWIRADAASDGDAAADGVRLFRMWCERACGASRGP